MLNRNNLIVYIFLMFLPIELISNNMTPVISYLLSDTTYKSPDDIAKMLESDVNSIDGNITSSHTSSDGTLTINILGEAMCMPTDPYMTPLTPPNIYGCENNASIAYNGVNLGDNTITFNVSTLIYVDYVTISVLGTDDGYAEGYVSGEVTYELIDNGDGTYTIDKTFAPTINLTVSDTAMYSINPIVQANLTLLLPTIEIQIDDLLMTTIFSLSQQFITDEYTFKF